MDALNRRIGQVVPFSDHLAERSQRGFSHHKIPSREEVLSDYHGMESFHNEIPLDDYNGGRTPDWPLRNDSRPATDSHNESKCRKALMRKLLLPTVIVTVPMTLLAACFLGLVFGYRVRSGETLFPSPNDPEGLKDHLNVLVNFSATRLVFVASWASTLATILGGFIMTLWSFRIAQEIRKASVDGKRNELPTAYQLSLLIGLELASADRLRRLISYSHKTHTRIPPVLKQSAWILSLGSLLSIAVLLGDTIIHYTTTTISFNQIEYPAQMSELGRGLSQTCLEMNRMDNTGLPCSLNFELSIENPLEYEQCSNQISFLQLNNSKISEIRMLPRKSPARGDVAILLPQTQSLSPYVDYRASTIGVATECTLISEKCKFRVGGPQDTYSFFNCSPNFWGILGKRPIISELDGVSPDPNVSALAFKPAPNVQYSFFSDEALDIVYNTPGYNLTTGGGSNTPALRDDQLVNPVYVAIAGRLAETAELAGVDLSTQPGVFKGPNHYIDFVLNCAYETYEVEYSWVNNTVRDIDTVFTATRNGSIAEIFHGYNTPLSVDGGDADYQQFLVNAGLQPTTVAMAKTWADLLSVKILSVIGAFTSGRATTLQQNRFPLLVARVPKIALAVLVTSCLAYTALGLWLFKVAFNAGATTDIRDLVGRLSLPGVAMYAFGGDTLTTNKRTRGQGTGMANVFDETAIGEEESRVGVFGDPEMGYDYKLL